MVPESKKSAYHVIHSFIQRYIHVNIWHILHLSFVNFIKIAILSINKSLEIVADSGFKSRYKNNS